MSLPVFRGKQVHRIDCTTSGRGDRVLIHYKGELIGDSATPMRTAAKVLKEHVSEFDTLEMWRGEMLCMTGVIGVLAIDKEKET